MSNGFTFGGVHSDSLGLIVNSKTIPASPPVTNRLQEIGGVDGAWDYGVSYGPRELEIDVTILGDTPADTRRSVRKLVGTMNPRKGSQILIFDDEPDIMYYARISNQVPLDTLGAMGTFTLQLVCPDPFAYGIENRVDTFAKDWGSEGRNLVIRQNEIEKAYYGLDGTMNRRDDFTTSVSAYPISVVPGESLVFQKTSRNGFDFWRCNWLDSDGVFLSRFANNPNRFTTVVPEGAEILEVSYPDAEDVMITRGSEVYPIAPAPEDATVTIYAEPSGTQIALPIVTIEYGGGSGTISNKRADGIVEKFTFKSDSPAGTYVIDSKQKTITIGGNRAYKYVSGDFISLASGSNHITSSKANIENLTVEYRDTWI